MFAYTTHRFYAYVQFCANNPDTFTKACLLAEPYCDAIDLNLGCPQTIARKGER